MRNYAKAYSKYGIDLSPSSDPDNLVGQCPFSDCGKDFHFSVGKENGAWQCFRCGKTGNLYTFLKEWHAKCREATTEGHYKSLWKLRGINPKTLAQFSLAWDKVNRCWLLPIYKINEHGRKVMVNLKQWRQDADGNSEFHGTPTCSSSLFNQPALFAPHTRYDKTTNDYIPVTPPPSDLYIDPTTNQPADYPYSSLENKPIWICEGEWDALALIQFDPPAIVVATPGANSFKDEWTPWFANREVVLLFDNDDPGRSGAKRTGESLIMHHTPPKSVHVLDWPEKDGGA